MLRTLTIDTLEDIGFDASGVVMALKVLDQLNAKYPIASLVFEEYSSDIATFHRFELTFRDSNTWIQHIIFDGDPFDPLMVFDVEAPGFRPNITELVRSLRAVLIKAHGASGLRTFNANWTP